MIEIEYTDKMLDELEKIFYSVEDKNSLDEILIKIINCCWENSRNLLYSYDDELFTTRDGFSELFGKDHVNPLLCKGRIITFRFVPMPLLIRLLQTLVHDLNLEGTGVTIDWDYTERLCKESKNN